MLGIQNKPVYVAALFVYSLLLSACNGPAVHYQQPEMNIPKQWSATSETGMADNSLLDSWWQHFHDALLTKLVTNALHSNLDVATAQAQLQQARALRDLANANLGPSVDVSASASRSKSSKLTGSGRSSDLYKAGFDASWEADIFGRLHYASQAAQADVETSQQNLYAIQVSLAAEVATTYLQLRTVQTQLKLTEESLNVLRESYQITQWRKDAGLVSDLDVAQARTQLETTQSTIPQLQNTISQYMNALALLLAKTPGEVNTELLETATIPQLNQSVAVGIPADTLRHRPDVHAAEQALRAQTMRLGEAEAARYPALNLSGSLGLQALTFGALDQGDAETHSLLAGITAPIFDSGRIKANIAAQDAILEQKRLAYQSVVLVAIQDVENALVNITNTSQRLTRLKQATRSAQDALALAEYQYNSGLVDFVSVLDSQRALFDLQNQLAGAEGQRATAYVQLYKALGGGWSATNQHKGSMQ